MSNRILLFDRTETEIGSQLHQIPIVNPTFQDLPVPQRGWLVNSGTLQGWSFGPTGAHYDGSTALDQSFVWPIYQNFQFALHPDTFYRIEITLSELTTGGVTVRVGNQTVLTSTTTSLQSAVFNSSDGIYLGESVVIYPFSGSVLTVGSIKLIQDGTLSPVQSIITYEPKGYLDVYEDEPVAISYDAADVQDLSARFGSFSKVFDLPGTRNNRIMLSHIESFAPVNGLGTAFDPRRRHKAIYQNNGGTAFEGWLSLKSITRVGDEVNYSVELLSKSFDLMDHIKGLYVQDLNLDTLTHTLNLETVLSSHTASRTWREGFVYPLYLLLANNYTINDDFRPSYFYRDIIDRVVTQAGYNYTLSPRMEAKLNRMLIAPVGKRPTANAQEIAEERTTASTSGNSFNNLSTGYNSEGDDPAPYASRTLRWEHAGETGSFYLFNSSSYRPQWTGKYDITGSIDAIVSSAKPFDNADEANIAGGEGSYTRLGVWEDDGNTLLSTLDIRDFPAHIGYPYSASYLWSGSAQVQLTAGKKYSLRLEIKNQSTYNVHVVFLGTVNNVYLPISITAGDGQVSFTPGAAWGVGEHMTVKASDFLPRLSQESILTDFLTLFNVQIKTDPNQDRLVHFVAWDELPRDRVIDLGDVIDMDSPIDFEYLTEVSGSAVEFNYAKPNDKDDFNWQWSRQHQDQAYGSTTFSYETDFYTKPNTLELKNFTPCPITRDYAGRWCPAVLSRSVQPDVKLLVLGETMYHTEYQVAYFDKTQQAYCAHTVTNYVPCLHINDIKNPTNGWDANFGEVDTVMTNTTLDLPSNTLVSAHYIDQLRQYRDGRLFSFNAKLNLAQIQDLTSNVGSPIWMPQLKGYFSLYKITDFDLTRTDHDLTKLSLLELKNMDPIIPVGYTYRADPMTFTQVGLDVVQSEASTSSAGGLSQQGSVFNITNNVVNGSLYLPYSGGTGGPYTFINGTRVIGPLTATTYYSGSTELSQVFQSMLNGFTGGTGGTPTRIVPGDNIITGGTSPFTTVSVGLMNDINLNSVGVNFVNSIDIYNLASTNTGQLNADIATITSELYYGGGGADGDILFLEPSAYVANSSRFRYVPNEALYVINTGIFTNRSISGATFYSGSTELGSLFRSMLTGATGTVTGTTGVRRILPGLNILTGGTAPFSAITVSTSPTPTFTSVTITQALTVPAITASTLYLNHQDVTDALGGITQVVQSVGAGTNMVTGGTSQFPILSTTLTPSFNQVTESGQTLSSKYLARKTPITTVTAPTYTPVLADAETLIQMSGGSPQLFVVPSNTNVAFDIGSTINVAQAWSGQTSFSGQVGVSLSSIGGRLKMLGQYGGVSLVKRSTNDWLLMGALSF